ncbi:MAG TPA: hypothetical protein VES20_21335 [Bryobacteraceae bacterium]|nr:hypothetical protein [Bryobacteraceae bacterium]
MRTALLMVTAAALVRAEKVLVYSPFTRVDPTGQVVKADRGAVQPRHILSPGIPRNAFSSLRIVVELDKPGGYFLDIGQNPENAVRATLYRENWVETPDGYLPDTLTKVAIPYQGFATDFRVPGQKVVSFWLDMWVDAKAEVDRVKVEPQLWPESVQDWIVYPMEVRIQQPVVPATKQLALPELPELGAPADAVAYPFLRAKLCGGKLAPATDPPGQTTGRELLRRNVAQHIALGATLELQPLFTKAAGVTDISRWCKAPATPPAGPEWYLRFRDLVYHAMGAGD